jgi:preprotein translocase subunit SecY
MIPIIFAIAVITFPSILAQFLQNSSISTVATGAKWIIENLT